MTGTSNETKCKPLTWESAECKCSLRKGLIEKAEKKYQNMSQSYIELENVYLRLSMAGLRIV